jgi:hypothetical protein
LPWASETTMAFVAGAALKAKPAQHVPVGRTHPQGGQDAEACGRQGEPSGDHRPSAYPFGEVGGCERECEGGDHGQDGHSGEEWRVAQDLLQILQSDEEEPEYCHVAHHDREGARGEGAHQKEPRV